MCLFVYLDIEIATISRHFFLRLYFGLCRQDADVQDRLFHVKASSTDHHWCRRGKLPPRCQKTDPGGGCNIVACHSSQQGGVMGDFE